MLGRSFQDIYVAACGEPFNTRASGVSHERSCPACWAAMNAEQSQPDDSYSLAVGHVVGQIDDEFRDHSVVIGTKIDASDLEDCDCVPVDVLDCRNRRWLLRGVAQVVWRGEYGLRATYEYIGD